MSPSQVPPPNAMTRSGSAALSRLAGARLGTFCMKVVVKPTTRGRSARTSSATRSMNPAACSRILVTSGRSICRPAAYSVKSRTPKSGSSCSTPVNTQSPMPSKRPFSAMSVYSRTPISSSETSIRCSHHRTPPW